MPIQQGQPRPRVRIIDCDDGHAADGVDCNCALEEAINAWIEETGVRHEDIVIQPFYPVGAHYDRGDIPHMKRAVLIQYRTT